MHYYIVRYACGLCVLQCPCIYCIGMYVLQLDCMYCSGLVCIAVGFYVLQWACMCMYCSWLVCIILGLYVLQMACMYCSWLVCIAVGVYVLQLACMYCSWLVCIAVGLYVLQLACLYCSWIVCIIADNAIKGVLNGAKFLSTNGIDSYFLKKGGQVKAVEYFYSLNPKSATLSKIDRTIVSLHKVC